MRRTKKSYAHLYDDPSALFGDGTEVILYPNGEPGTIWVKGPHGTGIEFRASAGPYGLSWRVHTFVGASPMTVMTTDKEYAEEQVRHDAREVGGVQYFANEEAHEYRDAYWSRPSKLNDFYEQHPEARKRI